MVVKLYYFDGRGICEPIRWILSYGGINFEEVRAPVNEFPPTLPAEIKSKCRWGQVPLVEFDGKSLTQSLAICRYFAKKSNLIPQDLFEAALCDEYVDAVKDMMPAFYQGVVLENDEQKKKEKLQEVVATTKTRFLNVFESILKSNGGKYLVGNHLSMADVWLAYVIHHMHLLVGVDLTTDYPGLKSLLNTVVNAQGIKQWIEKRPKTEY